MPIEVRADFFWFDPVDGGSAGVVRAIEQYVQHNPPAFIEEAFHDVEYRLAHLAWDPQAGGGRLTGVMYRKRDRNLPSSLNANGDAPIPIGDDDSIGDPVCFCYYPRAFVGVVQFSQVGARHATLRSFLPVLGTSPLATSPIFTPGMLERLNDVRIIRSFEFSLKNAGLDQQLGQLGAGVGESLNMLREMNGVNVHVSVSVGPGRPRHSLSNGIKAVARRLAGRDDVVSTLKLRGKPDVDEEIEAIDLLHDRRSAHLEVDENDRQIDVDDCLQRMHAAYINRRREIAQQRNAEQQQAG